MIRVLQLPLSHINIYKQVCGFEAIVVLKRNHSKEVEEQKMELELGTLLQPLIPSWNSVSNSFYFQKFLLDLQQSNIGAKIKQQCRKAKVFKYFLYILVGLQIGIYMIYLAYVAIASFILPAKVVPGIIMQDGTRLRYRCNGLSFFLLIYVSL